MQFNAIPGFRLGFTFGKKRAPHIGKPPPGALNLAPLQQPAAQPPAAAEPKSGVEMATQNLLNHIPGEASGFYMLATASIASPTLGTLALLFTLGLVLLILVRWLNKATLAVMITTIIAYVLWMAILDKGFIHVAAPSLMPPPLGIILAFFYSTVVTLLASAGKLR